MGDVHGKFDSQHTLSNIIEAMPTNSLIIQVGDFGIGFHLDREKIQLGEIDCELEKNDVTLWAIRGNHDDPSFWKDDTDNYRQFHSDLSNIELIPDYSWRIINDHKFLFIGGAISIDREKRDVGVNYWIDEIVYIDEDKLHANAVDVLITHTCSDISGFPVDSPKIDYYSSADDKLREDIIREKSMMAKIMKIDFKEHYYGHFHQSSVQYIGEKKHVCLDIEEVRRILDYE